MALDALRQRPEDAPDDDAREQGAHRQEGDPTAPGRDVHQPIEALCWPWPLSDRRSYRIVNDEDGTRICSVAVPAFSKTTSSPSSNLSRAIALR